MVSMRRSTCAAFSSRAFVFVCAFSLAAASRGRAVPSSLGPEPEVELLLAAGLDTDAEGQLRAALARGDESARLPLAELLLRNRRAKDAQAVLRDAKKPARGVRATRIFTQARIYEEREAHSEAAEAYVLSATHEPLLADHAMFRAGIERAREDEAAPAIAAFEAAGAAARTSWLADRAYFRAAEIALSADDVAKAAELLERIPPRSTLPRVDRLAMEARWARAAADAAREERTLRELLEAFPSTPAALDATERLPAIANVSVEDRFRFAEVALANRHAGRAEDELEAAAKRLGKDPAPEDEGRLRWLAGRAKMLRREYSAARRELAGVPPRARVAERAAAALDAARCLWRLEQIDACLAEYDAITESSFPESARAAATWEAAREAKDDRRFEDAASRFERFRREFPRHELAGESLWQRGRALAALGDAKGARAAFEAIAASPPEAPRREEARFWHARVLFDEGKEKKACRELAELAKEAPDSYWAHRAREVASERCDVERASLKESDASAWLQGSSTTADPGDASSRTLRESELFERARTLAALGLPAEAEAELAGLRGTMDFDERSLLAFAEAAWSIGVPREAMRAVSTLKRRRGGDVMSGDVPPSIARLLYPVAHLEDVQRWAAENNLDPMFVLAVMREESWLDPSAVSSAGARGLLQIMPATGFDLAPRAGVRGFSADDLFRPDINVRLGARYLRELLDTFGGQPVLALAAYNAGEPNATRWRADGHFDVDEYVAGITFTETHGYVQKVMRTWAIYRALWSDVLGQLRGGEESNVDRAPAP